MVLVRVYFRTVEDVVFISFFDHFLCVFCFVFFTVIGGKSIYVRLSVSGECYNNDSVWKKLQEEVLL